MWVVPAEHYSQAAKYATFCDMFMIAPHLYDGLKSMLTDQTHIQECDAARTEAISEWERIKSIESESDRIERMATVLLEVFTWSQDFHLRTASALALLKLGRAEDPHCFHFFSLLANSGIHATLGFPLAAECALSLPHWRVNSTYVAHRALQMSFPPKMMADAVKLLMQRVHNDERQPVERKRWAQLLALWIDPAHKSALEPGELKQDSDLYVSYALCREDREILRAIVKESDSPEMRQAATSLLTRLGEPPEEIFGTKDPAVLKNLLRMVRGALNARVLEQIFREAAQHQVLIWDWLRSTNKSDWKDEGLRLVLLQHMAGPLLQGLPVENLADYLAWVFDIFAEDGQLIGRKDLEPFVALWDERIREIDPKEQEKVWYAKAYPLRLACAQPESLASVIEKLGIVLTQTAINQLSDWDRNLERNGWKSEVKEGHFVLVFAGRSECVRDIRSNWNIREDDPVAALLWQAVTDGHPHAANLLMILSSAYPGIPALKAAARRFAAGKSLDDIIGDPVGWTAAAAKFYTLYDSVEFLDWVPATPDSWSSFFLDFEKRFHAGKPELGQLNAWIKFAGKLKVRLDQSPQVWEPLLRRFLKGWHRALDCANGVVREHDYKQADSEMARTLLRDSSSILCLLAG